MKKADVCVYVYIEWYKYTVLWSAVENVTEIMRLVYKNT